MANLQKQFDEFHKNIRVKNDDEKAKLQIKRDLLVSNLKDGLKKHKESTGESLKFEHFNQGSYAMHTGTKPISGEYDIDVGILFDNVKKDFDNPVALKKIVKKAINSNFRTVNIRRPCVTASYQKNGKPEYHVDMAIYVKIKGEDTLHIAMGKEHSTAENIEWVKSDPKGLTEIINDRFSGGDRKQFKRTIRFLKRWRDKKFTDSNEAPISIALTCAAYHWFEAKKTGGEYSDLKALLSLAKSMINEFSWFSSRLTINLPVTPKNDLLEGMTDKQMESFKEKLDDLCDALQGALDEKSMTKACKKLKKHFGDEFPIAEETTKASLKSYVSPVVTTGGSA